MKTLSANPNTPADAVVVNGAAAAIAEIAAFKVDRKRFFLKSLYDTDKGIQGLQLHFDAALDSAAMSQLVVVAEHPSWRLDANGTGTGPADIVEASYASVFADVAGGPLSKPEMLPKTKAIRIYLTHQELRALLYAAKHGNKNRVRFWNDLNAYANGSLVGFYENRFVDGSLLHFASSVADGIAKMTNEDYGMILTENVGPAFFTDTANVKHFVENAAHKLYTMPVGLYAYAFDFPEPLGPQTHKGVMIRRDGLMAEVICIGNDSNANAARPTSIMNFLERVLEKPMHIQYGLWYNEPEKPYSAAQGKYMAHRAVQMMGPWAYHLAGQNCHSYANWIIGNRFTSVFDCAENKPDYKSLPRY